MVRFQLGILLLLLFPVAASADAWNEFASDNFTVFSDADPGYIKKRVADFEAYRQAVFVFLGFPNTPATQKSRIYIFRSDKEFREYGNQWIAGYYDYPLNGPVMVMARHKAKGKKLQEEQQNLTLFHEYIHYLLRERTGVNFPGWYDEGLSDLLGAARIGADKVAIGASNPWRHYAAAGAQRLTVASLLENRSFQSGQQMEAFYPAAWLLTHYLMLGHLDGEPNYVPRLRVFLAAYAGGAVRVADFEKIMGVSTAELDRKLDVYAKKNYLMGYSIPVKSYAGALSQRRLGDNEALYHKADLLINADRASKASPLLAQSKKGEAFYARNRSLHAVLKARGGDHQSARSLADEALQLAGDDAVVLANAAEVFAEQIKIPMDETLYQRALLLGKRAYDHRDKTLQATNTLAELYALGGDQANALEMMMEMYQATPSRVELNLSIGVHLARTDSPRLAVPFLEKVVAFSHDEGIRAAAAGLIEKITITPASTKERTRHRR